MKLNTFLSLSIASLAALTSASSCCKPDHSHGAPHKHILSNYLAIWGGDLSLINSTFHPDVVLHSDRFPSATGKGSDLIQVTNRNEFTAFVQRSRNGWEQYYFTPIRSVQDEHSIAVRWKMNGVLGANFTLFPTPLAEGAAVTYNGTDFLVLDECTGLIREAHIAQDLISYFHAMGLEAITV